MKQTQLVGRAWLWIGLAVLSLLPFWIPQWQLDVKVSNFFYHPACSPAGWLLDCHPVYRFLFYSMIPVISWGIVILGLLVLFWRPQALHYQRLRVRIAYFVLVFILGSGLVVNGIFKSNWGRPRPVQTQDFGGIHTYAPPGKLVLGNEGRSFPSGHSSVGFTFLALWFVWRRARPHWAFWGLGAGLLLGYAVGLARISVGAHYLSDVIGSGWMMALVAWLVYYPIMQMPKREQAWQEAAALNKPL